MAQAGEFANPIRTSGAASVSRVLAGNPARIRLGHARSHVRRLISAVQSSARTVSLMSASALLALHVWMLNRYAVDFPSADDYTQILAVPGFVRYSPTAHDAIAYLLSGTPEHRIVTIRLIALAQTALWHFDFRQLLFLGNAIALMAWLRVLLEAPRRYQAWLAPIFVISLLNPTAWHAQYWPTAAVQHLALIGYAILAIDFAVRDKVRWTVMAAVFALLAAGTALNGLLVFPAVALAVSLTHRRRQALAWLFAGAMLGGIYFTRYTTPSGQPELASVLAHPIVLATNFLEVLGGMVAYFGDSTVSTVTLGLAIASGLVLLVALCRRYPCSPRNAGWLVFFVTSVALITLGRANLGPDAIFSSRYRPYSATLFVLVLVSLMDLLKRAGLHGISGVILSVVFSLSVGWGVLGWTDQAIALSDFAVGRRLALDHYAATAGLTAFGEFPPQPFGDFLLKRARDAGQFVPEAHADLPRHLDPAISTGAARSPFCDTTALWARGGALSVSGRTYAEHAGVAFWLRGDKGQYRGRTQILSIPDLPWHSAREAFFGTYLLSNVKPGEYEIGYATDDAPGVFWVGQNIRLP
jgi:hypothetical protein